MKISIIAAVSENGAIGKDNKLLWKLSSDMKIFKTLTTGHHVIMGRKTFDSMNGRPLPNRTNVIISRNLDYDAEGCETAISLAEALSLANQNGDEEAFIIGGGEIYKLGMYIANTLYISHVHTNIEGDTYFPSIDTDIWKLKTRESYIKDEKNECDFDFCVYERKTIADVK
jgi:dihydrofolate reductase